MKTESPVAAARPPTARLVTALTFFLIALACPVVATIVLASDASGPWKAAAGFLYFPIPEVFDITAISIVGKPGFDWLKAIALGYLKKVAPPDEVGVVRYRIGLIMFFTPLAFGWLHPYLAQALPVLSTHRLIASLLSDFLLIVSLFVLGGNFWDKLRSLFVRKATVDFPKAS